jgi:hypothetical protein
MELRREIDEIQTANLKYAMQKRHNEFQREADSSRRQRLAEILTELAEMTCWREAG